jgi:hypothetical protein
MLSAPKHGKAVTPRPCLREGRPTTRFVTTMTRPQRRGGRTLIALHGGGASASGCRVCVFSPHPRPGEASASFGSQRAGMTYFMSQHLSSLYQLSLFGCFWPPKGGISEADWASLATWSRGDTVAVRVCTLRKQDCRTRSPDDSRGPSRP